MSRSPIPTSPASVAGVRVACEEVLVAGGQMVGEVIEAHVEGRCLLMFDYVRDPKGNIIELQCWPERNGLDLGRMARDSGEHEAGSSLSIDSRSARLRVVNTFLIYINIDDVLTTSSLRFSPGPGRSGHAGWVRAEDRGYRWQAGCGGVGERCSFRRSPALTARTRRRVATLLRLRWSDRSRLVQRRERPRETRPPTLRDAIRGGVPWR